MRLLRTAARATWHFAWDFLVGDTPELFVASLVLVAVAFGVASQRALAVVLLPALAVAALALSAARGRRRSKKAA